MRGAAVFSRSVKMLGARRTIAAYGTRVGKATLSGAWKGTKVLGLGAAALWAGGGGRSGRGEIQLGNEDSYGDGGMGTGTGTNTAAVVTELPGLKSPEQPEKISAPTVATIIQSVDRLTSVATGIADNLLNLQNILVGQINQSSDAAREAMIEGRTMPQVTQQQTSDDKLEGALGNLAATANPQPGIIDKVISGALTAWGISSLVKGFFTKSAAAEATASRTAAAAASRGTAAAATRTATVLRATGTVARFATRAAGPLTMAAGIYGMNSAAKRGQVGEFISGAGTTALGASSTAAMLGAGAIAIPLAAAGVALSLASMPLLLGQNDSNDLLSRQTALGSRVPLYVSNTNWGFGVEVAKPDHFTLAGVNIDWRDTPQELKDLYYFYVPNGSAEADTAAKKVDNNRSKYITYLNTISSAPNLAAVAGASAIINGKGASERAAQTMIGGDPSGWASVKEDWTKPGALEAKILQKWKYRYYGSQAMIIDQMLKGARSNPKNLTEKDKTEAESQADAAMAEFQTRLTKDQIKTAQATAQAESQKHHEKKIALNPVDNTQIEAQSVQAEAAERGVTPAQDAMEIEAKLMVAQPRKPLKDLSAIPFNPEQNKLRPIGPETFSASQLAMASRIKDQTYDFQLPTQKPSPSVSTDKNGVTKITALGEVPNPSFPDQAAYDSRLYFLPSTSAKTG